MGQHMRRSNSTRSSVFPWLDIDLCRSKMAPQHSRPFRHYCLGVAGDDPQLCVDSPNRIK